MYVLLLGYPLQEFHQLLVIFKFVFFWGISGQLHLLKDFGRFILGLFDEIDHLIHQSLQKYVFIST